MIRAIGLFLVFLSWYGLSMEFDLKLLGSLVFGILMYCSEDVFSHFMSIEREIVHSECKHRRW